MHFLSRLRAVLHSTDADLSPHLVAAAALLVQVARSDGLLKPSEDAEMRSALGARFGLSEGDADLLLRQAGSADAEPAGLAEEALRGLEPEARPALLFEAYRIAAADGRVEEVEDDLVWRIGRLLGLGEAEIGRIRASALAGP